VECERLCDALKRVEGLDETVVLLYFWREDFCFLVEFIWGDRNEMNNKFLKSYNAKLIDEEQSTDQLLGYK
jgi:hypothetical protein